MGHIRGLSYHWAGLASQIGDRSAYCGDPGAAGAWCEGLGVCATVAKSHWKRGMPARAQKEDRCVQVCVRTRGDWLNTNKQFNAGYILLC